MGNATDSSTDTTVAHTLLSDFVTVGQLLSNISSSSMVIGNNKHDDVTLTPTSCSSVLIDQTTLAESSTTAICPNELPIVLTNALDSVLDTSQPCLLSSQLTDGQPRTSEQISQSMETEKSGCENVCSLIGKGIETNITASCLNGLHDGQCGSYTRTVLGEECSDDDEFKHLIMPDDVSESPTVNNAGKTWKSTGLNSVNGFNGSFWGFLRGDRVETLSSLANSTIRRRPPLPLYIPEPSRHSSRDDEALGTISTGLEMDNGDDVVNGECDKMLSFQCVTSKVRQGHRISKSMKNIPNCFHDKIIILAKISCSLYV